MCLLYVAFHRQHVPLQHAPRLHQERYRTDHVGHGPETTRRRGVVEVLADAVHSVALQADRSTNLTCDGDVVDLLFFEQSRTAQRGVRVEFDLK